MRSLATLLKGPMFARLLLVVLVGTLVSGCGDGNPSGTAAEREYREYMEQQYDDYSPYDHIDHYATYQAEYSEYQEEKYEEAERERLEELIEEEVDRRMCERYGDCD